jgi:polyisoprenoid-binding protein YceI
MPPLLVGCLSRWTSIRIVGPHAFPDRSCAGSCDTPIARSGAYLGFVKRYLIDAESSQVWVDGSSTVHPIHATATGLEGWIELAGSATSGDRPIVAGEVRIDVDRLRSGNGLVDRETRRRIDAGRFPEIVGTLESATIVDGNRRAVTGTVAFRGHDRRVHGELTLDVNGDEVVVEGSQRFDVRDWGLEPPRLGLLKVRPDVDVRIHLVARRQDAARRG